MDQDKIFRNKHVLAITSAGAIAFLLLVLQGSLGFFSVIIAFYAGFLARPQIESLEAYIAIQPPEEPEKITEEPPAEEPPAEEPTGDTE